MGLSLLSSNVPASIIYSDSDVRWGLLAYRYKDLTPMQALLESAEDIKYLTSTLYSNSIANVAATGTANAIRAYIKEKYGTSN